MQKLVFSYLSELGFLCVEAHCIKTDMCIAKDIACRFLEYVIVNSYNVNRSLYKTLCNFMTLFDMKNVFSILC